MRTKYLKLLRVTQEKTSRTKTEKIIKWCIVVLLYPLIPFVFIWWVVKRLIGTTKKGFWG